MAHLVPNTFSSYQMTEQEELQASVLMLDQEQLLQSKLALVAEEKLALQLDPGNISAYVQQEADLKGQMIIINWLLDCSTAAKISLAEGAASQ